VDTGLYHLNYSGQADGSDLTDYAIMDVSASPIHFGSVPSSGRILSLRMCVSGGLFARLEWDATTDTLIVGGGGPVKLGWGYPDVGPLINADMVDLNSAEFLQDPANSGQTGDILLTTINGAAGEGISIQMTANLKSA